MIVLLALGSIAVAFGILAFDAWVISMNINDMLTNGVNFWNVFWIITVLVLSFGGAGIAKEKS